jgi:hypothetical protein
MSYAPQYFDLSELVCPHVFNKFGSMAWSFFDPRLLVIMDHIRDLLDKPIFVNNWNEGGQFSQRGLRCIQCDLVKAAIVKNDLYMSAHMEGQAVDFDVEGMTAEQVRQWIISKKQDMPVPIRLENGVQWVHLDVREYNGEKVHLFNS